MYILRCSDGSYYTGSTKDILKRLSEHQQGLGAKHTKKYGPVELVYVEKFSRIDLAFYREKQIQGWTTRKKEALIASNIIDLEKLAECSNSSHHSFAVRNKSSGEQVSL